MISYAELAYMILEADKCYDLLSESWRCRGASGVILCESIGLRTREANCPWAGKEAMRCPSSTVKQKKNRKKKNKVNFPFFHLLSYSNPEGWIMPTHFGEDNLLYESTCSNTDLLQKHPHSHSQT